MGNLSESHDSAIAESITENIKATFNGVIKFSDPTRSPLLKEGEELVNCVFKDKYTLPESFDAAVEKFGDKVLYTFRDVKKHHIEKDMESNKEIITYEHGPKLSLTYKQTSDMVNAIASAIKQHNEMKCFEPKSRIGIYMDTCKEWMIFAQACWKLNCAVVTCYANLGIDALVHVIDECELEILFVHAEKIKFINEFLKDKCPSLKFLVVVGNATQKSEKYQIVKFLDLVENGKKQILPIKDLSYPETEDIAVINYTSGTTGDPKGVVILHKNIVCAVAGICKHLDPKLDDVYLSYLPLAHTFELMGQNTSIMSGMEVGFGTPRTLVAKTGGAKLKGDLEVMKPTILAGVPRVWETIKKGVLTKLRKKSPISKAIFNTIMKKKVSKLKKGKDGSVMLEKKIFSKIRDVVGGRLRILVSGAAPLSEECHHFLQAALGKKCPVIQGFGLTETCSATCIQVPDKFRAVGNIGVPLPCCEVRLKDVPDMNYFVANNHGEMQVKGNNVFGGYYKKPKKTDEVFETDKHEWFCTGDICRKNGNGTYSVIDRKKNLCKLSHGEYVALENLESLFASSPFLSPNGLVIIGNSLYSFLIAVALCDQNYALEWAGNNKIKEKDVDKIVEMKSYRDAVLKSFQEIGKKSHKKKWEIIQKVRIFNELWTPENGMTTASMKIKRRAVKEKYEDEITEMFNEK